MGGFLWIKYAGRGTKSASARRSTFGGKVLWKNEQKLKKRFDSVAYEWMTESGKECIPQVCPNPREEPLGIPVPDNDKYSWFLGWLCRQQFRHHKNWKSAYWDFQARHNQTTWNWKHPSYIFQAGRSLSPGARFFTERALSLVRNLHKKPLAKIRISGERLIPPWAILD
jgi:hypothetical protein